MGLNSAAGRSRGTEFGSASPSEAQAGGPVGEVSTVGGVVSQSPENSLEVAAGLWIRTPPIGDSAGPPADALTPGSMLQAGEGGRYRIVREVGRGGMGVVYEAFDLQLQRSVAIKTMRVEDASSAPLRRFLREARIASRLHHPGIMAVHEFGVTHDGHAYMVMGLLRGQTLAELLAAREACGEDIPRLLAVFLQTCQAVASAHAVGIVHRDLKPANVMVGEYGMVTVMDWGLAKDIGTPVQSPDAGVAGIDSPLHKADRPTPPDDLQSPSGVPTDDTHTLSGSVFGTPGYLSPEQARGDVAAVDRRADAFGLGGILCEILTGGRPYVADGALEMWRQAREGDTSGAIVRLDACAGPMPMIALCRRCLSASPENRPSHAGELVAACVEYLESGQRRAEQQLVRFFDLSADLFCIANLAGYFLRVNDNFPRLLGYPTVDLLSRQFVEFVHPDDRETTVAELQNLSNGVETIQFVNRYRHADGHYLWLEWNARPVPEEGVVYADARDVTDRVERDLHRQRLEKALEASRRDLADFTENANVPLHWVNGEGVIIWANKAELDFLGYTRPEYVGQPISRFHADEPVIEDILTRLSAGQCLSGYEARLRAKDGSIKDVSIHSSVYRENGEFRHTRCFTVDISARRQGERAAREQARLAVFVAEVCRMMLRGGDTETLALTFAAMVAAGLPAAGVHVWLADTPWRLIGHGGNLAMASLNCEPPDGGCRKARWTNHPIPPDDAVATRWQRGATLLGAVEYPLRVEGRTIGLVEAVSTNPIGVAAYASFATACDALTLAITRRADPSGVDSVVGR